MSSIRDGGRLATTYCGACHITPDPSLLDSRSWEKGVLPEMGPRLGIFAYGFQLYPNSRRDTNISKGFYPSQPLLSLDDWQHIIDYYTALSPDTLPAQRRPEPIAMTGLSLFDVRAPAMRYPMPATTYLGFDTSAGERGISVYDYNYRKLYRFSPDLRLIDSTADQGGIVGMERQGREWVSCDIGELNPNNGKSGTLKRIESDGKGHWRIDSPAFYSPLARPVQAVAADINGDGRMDWVVCEFGNLVGALSWLENKGDSGFERHIIRASPGAIHVIVNDYNHDGLPDLWVLFAQGDEGIFLFTNLGNGRFRQQTLLRFPPSFGSSSFDLADFNGDGYADILYTCGDNADFSRVLKPYHGVYIFLNDGHNHFSQRYFFPIDGCYKAVARDFDGDGDLDIATIAFFPDLAHQPQEGFVYLENLGDFRFRPYSLPQAQQGKWLTMDVGDVDGDGKPDIVLGNFSYFAPVTPAGVDFKRGPPFLLLKNLSK